MTTKTYEEHNLFEQGMVEHLVDSLQYRRDDALRLVDEYAPVLERLKKHYNCEDYAKLVHEASENGLTPQRWIERINKLEQPAAAAKKSHGNNRTALQ